jgi:hypothetical protein
MWIPGGDTTCTCLAVSHIVFPHIAFADATPAPRRLSLAGLGQLDLEMGLFAPAHIKRVAMRLERIMITRSGSSELHGGRV